MGINYASTETQATAKDFYWKHWSKEKSHCELECIQKGHSVCSCHSRIDIRESKDLLFDTEIKHKMNILKYRVGSLYIVGLLLLNIRNCLYLNQVYQHLECSPPSIEKYLAPED